MKQVQFLNSISHKLLVAILCLPVMVTIAVFFLFQHTEYQRISHFSEDRLNYIENTSTELLMKEKSLFKETILRLAADNQIIVPLKLNVKFQLESNIQFLRQRNNLDYLTMIDKDGYAKSINFSEKNSTMSELAFSKMYRAALGGKMMVLYQSLNYEKPHLYLVAFAPVFSNKRVIAVLFAAKKIKLSKFFNNCILVSHGLIQSATDNALFIKSFINKFDSVRHFGRIPLADKRFFVSKAPIPDFKNLNYYLISAVDGRPAFKEYKRILALSAIVFFIVLLFLIFYSFLLSKWLSNPLIELVSIANAVTANKKEVNWLRNRNDEFGVLSNALKKMTGNLHSSIGELHIANDKVTESNAKLEKYRLNLEIMVEERTCELSTALSNLQNTQTQLIQSEKMASIGQLAAGVAHEINNPIGFVNSNINSLSQYNSDIMGLLSLYGELVISIGNRKNSDDTSLLAKINNYEQKIDIEFISEDSHELIDDCLKGLERVKNIVCDLKDFSHPGDEKLRDVDIENGIEATLNILANELKYKAVVIKDYGELLPILGMPQQINQVFMNIFINAVQAMDEPGEIVIKTRYKQQHDIIEISDTGNGIAEENIQKIFDPFFTTKEVGKGTGLGMNIVYNIVKKHNGVITVESKINHGTTFTIKFPVIRE